MFERVFDWTSRRLRGALSCNRWPASDIEQYSSRAAAFGKQIYATTPGPASRKLDLRQFGSGSAGYTVECSELSKESIVYSLGIGCDITFDLALIESFGLHVWGYDPTTEAARYVRKVSPPSNFFFSQQGVCACSGKRSLMTIKKPSRLYRAATLLGCEGIGGKVTDTECIGILDLPKRNKHSRIAILKMDIEGAEYEILRELSSDEIYFNQLAVEFHPHLLNVSKGLKMTDDYGWIETEQAICALIGWGFAVAYVSDRGTEFSFVRSINDDLELQL